MTLSEARRRGHLGRLGGPLGRLGLVALLVAGAPAEAAAEEALVPTAQESGTRGPRERSDWYLGVGQAFGILFSGRQQVAPGSLTQVRIGAVVRPRFLVGAEIHSVFDIGKTTQSVLSGTVGGLIDFTAFPLHRTGFFIRAGAGAGAYWSQLRSTFARPGAIQGESEGRQLAPGGAGMLAIGHELWLGRNVNLGIHLRYDGMVIFDGPRLVNGVVVGVSLIVY